ncbi:MAG TPA: pyrroline-5-carboxylate reductase, partial [Micavibrio sp.]
KLALIGCGKMGSAILRGWLAAGERSKVLVLDPAGLPPELTPLVDGKVAYFKSTSEFVKAATAEKPDVFLLAVKPQVMEAACRSIAPAVSREALILSIAAGQAIASFEKRFALTQSIVRAMPNTPAAIGKGITIAVAGRHVSAAQKQIAAGILQTTGVLEWIDDEGLLDAVTALSGSGPAYVFLLIDTLASAGMKAGLPTDLAGKLARQTVIGAAALAESEPDTDAAQLRKNVTSPGGTTEAALKVLMNGELQEIFDAALTAATARGRELNK